jgi:membrane associated rhomboid family serine protease
MAGAITNIKISLVPMGTVVGASGAIYGVIVAFAFMFPNAELALMFIPVPIKAKYLYQFSFSRFVFRSLRTIYFWWRYCTFAHVGGALFGFLIMWYWKNQFQ